MVVGSMVGDGGAYSSGAVPPEQRAPPAVREDRRQPTAYGAPPARQQPPPADEEEEVNDYDSDEASEYTICSPFSWSDMTDVYCFNSLSVQFDFSPLISRK